MKIIVLDGYTENPGDLSWDALAALGDLTVYEHTPADEILSRIGDAEIVITNKTPISAETMDACPGIRYVGVLATGYNVVDVAAARARGRRQVRNGRHGLSAGVCRFTNAPNVYRLL